MGRMGNFNIDGLKKFRDELNKLQDPDKFVEVCAKELAARLLRMVVKRTPVGEYPKSSGKKGGTLRRGWTGEKRSSAQNYADSLTVHHFGDTYKYKNEDKTPNDKDELVAAEVKATLSNAEYTPIKNAIIDSRKDEHRLARSVNYCRKRLKELGKIEEAEEVKRFLFKPDNNYRITYVAAGVSSRENVDDVIELDFSGEELEIRKNELIFYVHGKKLMKLAHNIYQRCCK